MTRETQTKLQGLLANPNFCNGLYGCMEAEEAFAYFKEHGLELTENEALKTWNDVEYDQGAFGSLSDDALDSVVGGYEDKPNGCIKICTLYAGIGLCIKWEYI